LSPFFELTREICARPLRANNQCAQGKAIEAQGNEHREALEALSVIAPTGKGRERCDSSIETFSSQAREQSQRMRAQRRAHQLCRAGQSLGQSREGSCSMTSADSSCSTTSPSNLSRTTRTVDRVSKLLPLRTKPRTQGQELPAPRALPARWTARRSGSPGASRR